MKYPIGILILLFSIYSILDLAIKARYTRKRLTSEKHKRKIKSYFWEIFNYIGTYILISKLIILLLDKQLSKFDKLLYKVFLIKYGYYFNVITKLKNQDVFFKSK